MEGRIFNKMTDNINSVSPNSVSKSETPFKKPLPVKRFKKRKVLDEDTYLLNMGKIIERDFFPDLKKLHAQNDYLDAVEKNDILRLREIYAKYTSGKRLSTERYNSPATFETPIDSRPSDDNQLREDSVGDISKQTDSNDDVSEKGEHRMSLNQYLANYTSEDNKSFEDIIEESEMKRKQKYPWLYKDEQSNREALQSQLALPSIEEQSKMIVRPLNLDSWGYKNRNYIMYVPDGVDLTPEEKVELAKRPQEVTHCNTRFNVNPFDEIQNKEKIQGLAQQQVKTMDGKIGLDGKELVPRSPKVSGYSFVKTPSPAPGVSESPLMTWGEIEGTPFRLDGGDTPVPSTPGPSFWIPEPPKREKLAHKLADKVNEQYRDRKKRAMEAAKKQLVSPRPGTAKLERLQSMSPAAQRFASTHLKKAIGTDRALLASYSPASVTPSRTPARSTRSVSSSPRTPHVTTDNLLKINVPERRPKASDFFT